jgi:hypothetical protein
MLTQLAEMDFGGFRAVWAQARRIRWSRRSDEIIGLARLATVRFQ